MTNITYPTGGEPLIDPISKDISPGWRRFFLDIWTRIGKGDQTALLLPRMKTTQRDALAATNGMVIYNTTDNKFQGYENGAWANLI